MSRNPRIPLPLIALTLTVTSACSTGEATDRGATDPGTAELGAIRTELIAMAEDDQVWEHYVIDQDPRIREPGFYAEKDRLQVVRLERCREIFDVIGLPTAEMVGEEAASGFWVLVQHGDADPAFQSRVLEAMRPAYERGEVDRSEFALLTDRVRVNTGRPQLYGTQVDYDGRTGQIRPKPIEDPALVDERRAEVDLEPLWEYVNSMTELHFQMNQAGLRAQGIDAPPLVTEGYSDW